MQRADAGMERHAELERMLTEVRRQVEAASAGQSGMQERTRALADQLAQLELAQVQAERSLILVRDALEQNAERVATDGRSADSINQRVGELRQSLAESEARLVTLTTNTQSISGAAAKADVLVTQVHQLTIGLQQITDLGGRVGAGLSDLEHMEEVIVGLTERTCRLEEARPLLTETVRDLGSLSATREAIRESLEQLRVARQELSTAHGTVETTRGWLGETERSVVGLRSDVAALDRMRTTLDTVRQEVDQINSAMGVVESRRGMVEDVQRRLSEAATLGASIESRATGLQQRIEAAEDHLGTLVPRLDEVGRAGGQLLQLGADLRDMENRLGQVQGSLVGMEERAQGLEELTERMRALSREIDQRQNALQRATEHLERATTLREEAAAAAALLADQARNMDATLLRSSDRMASLDELATQLDGRAAALATVLDRVTGFEAKLAEWHGVEQQLAIALDQAAGRQVAMTALQGEIRALHQVAERAQDDARAVVDAQPQLARARTELEAVLARLRETDGLSRSLEERRRQVDRVEERLSQATVLGAEVRASLETLLAQKAQVDHFLEKAMSLGLEARQAEGLLQALRDERRLSDRVRGALAELHRQSEDEPSAG
jgi:chromosome segregation ATPase